MRHDQRRAALAQLVQRLLDEDLGGVVQRAGGLVEYQDRGVFEEHARYGQALLLPAGELHAALADLGVVAVGQRHDVVVDVGAFGRLDHLVVGRVQPAVEDVLLDAAVEQEHVLLHDADAAAQRFERHVVYVRAVDENPPARRLVEGGDEVADGGLAAARGADQRQRLALFDVQRNVFENFLGAVIGEGDVIERDFALHVLKVARVRAFLFGLLVHDLEEALEAGHAVLILLHEVDQRGHRPYELIDRHDERRVIAEVDLARVHEQAARQHDHDVEHVGDERRGGEELRHRPVGLLARLDELGVALLELFGLLVGVGEGLRHAYAGNAALKRRIDHGDALAALGEGVAHALAAEQRDHSHDRHAGEYDQRQRHGNRAEIDERANDHDAADQQVLRAVMRQLAHVHQVVGHAGHDLAGLVLVVEGIGQRLELVEHIRAHLRLHPHAHHVAVILHEIAQQHPDGVERQQRQAVYHHHAHIVVGYEVVEHRAREYRIDHADHRDQQRGEHVQYEHRSVRPVVGDKALQHGEAPPLFAMCVLQPTSSRTAQSCRRSTHCVAMSASSWPRSAESVSRRRR